jgi:hypothetical protein
MKLYLFAQGIGVYFFSVVFCAFFAAVPQKTGLSGVPLRSIPSTKAATGCHAPGTLRAPPIPCAQEDFHPSGGLGPS